MKKLLTNLTLSVIVDSGLSYIVSVARLDLHLLDTLGILGKPNITVIVDIINLGTLVCVLSNGLWFVP